MNEAKISIGTYADDYIILPVTTLTRLERLEVKLGRKLLHMSWTKQKNDGTQLLKIGHDLAHEPTDRLNLQRTTDRWGMRSFDWVRAS